MEPPYGHQVYSASRIRLDSLEIRQFGFVLCTRTYFWLWNATCAYFPWLSEKQLFLLLLCASKFLFYSTCLSFLPSVLFWALRQQWNRLSGMGSSGGPGCRVWAGRAVGMGVVRTSRRRWGRSSRGKQWRQAYQRSGAELSPIVSCACGSSGPPLIPHLKYLKSLID